MMRCRRVRAARGGAVYLEDAFTSQQRCATCHITFFHDSHGRATRRASSPEPTSVLRLVPCRAAAPAAARGSALGEPSRPEARAATADRDRGRSRRPEAERSARRARGGASARGGVWSRDSHSDLLSALSCPRRRRAPLCAGKNLRHPTVTHRDAALRRAHASQPRKQRPNAGGRGARAGARTMRKQVRAARLPQTGSAPIADRYTIASHRARCASFGAPARQKHARPQTRRHQRDVDERVPHVLHDSGAAPATRPSLTTPTDQRTTHARATQGGTA